MSNNGTSTIIPIPAGKFTNSQTIEKVEFGNECKIIEDGVEGKGAFENCSNLSIINEGNKLEQIGNRAFFGTKISDVTFNHVKTIGNSAFENCASLTRISINTNCSSIGNSAFKGCTSLTSFVIPTGVKTIMNNTFSGCGLTSIEIPNSVTTIGDNAFYKCYGLTSVTIGYSVESIGDYAFSATKITSIEIPNSVKSIGSYAFNRCHWLTSVTIPNSVKSIGDVAFAYCFDIEKVYINDLSAWCGIEFGGKSANPLFWSSATGKNLYLNGEKLTKLVIPDNIKIANYAFCDCKSITEIIVPRNIKDGDIGEEAFKGCEGHDVYNYSTLNIQKDSIGHGCIAEHARNVYDMVDGDFIFDVIEGIYILIRYEGNDTNLSLPNRKEGYVIGAKAFSKENTENNEQITKIIIPNCVTSIEEYAFSGCSSLTSITIPNSVTSIGDCAFEGCIALKTIEIEDGNKDNTLTLGSELFYESSKSNTKIGLEYIYLGRNINGSENFNNLKKLKEVVFGNTVTNIRHTEFFNCTALTSVKIGEGVEKIGNNVFQKCTNLKSVEFNAKNCITMGSVSNPVFNGCTALSTVTIGENVINIPSYAFYNCSITNITIPNKVTNIGENAFGNCDNLTNISIGNSTTSINNKVFQNSPISSITVANTNTKYDSRDNCNAIIEKESNKLVLGCKNTDIPNSVTSIGEFAFYNCSGLESITIPNNVTSIGNSAFQWCKNASSIEIGNAVNTIGDDAFNQCSNAKTVYNFSNLKLKDEQGKTSYGYVVYYAENVYEYPGCSKIGDYLFNKDKVLFNYLGNGGDITLPQTLNNFEYDIDENVFKDNTTLNKITIPNSVKSIGNFVFNGCTKLREVIIEDANSDSNRVLNVGYNDSWNNHGLFHDCPLETLYLGRNINWGTENARAPFKKIDTLKNVRIGNKVTDICGYAFTECTAINEIIIPNGVTSIGRNAFYGCTSIKEIKIPNSVTNIGYESFHNCSGINKVIIDDSITSIGEKAFMNCTNINDIQLGDRITEIHNNAFYDCSSIPDIKIPNSVISIGNNAFRGCEKIKNIEIGDGVTSIGEYAFGECTILEKIEIGKSVTSIGNSAFYKCTSLKNLRFEDGDSEKILTLGYNGSREQGLFYDSQLETLYLGRNLSYETSYTYGYSPFYNKKSLVSATIGNNVTDIIGDKAFEGCNNLKTVINFSNLTFSKGSTGYGDIVYYADKVYNAPNGSIEEGFIFGKPNNITTLVGYLGDDTTLNIPAEYKGESVINIGNEAFLDYNILTSITIPNSVTSIGNSAFSGCIGITNIEIPNVTSIGNSAFSGCIGITNIEIPNVTSIGNSAFHGCSGLTSIKIPNGVTTINYGTFYNCTSLTSVTILDNVTKIEGYAFYNCALMSIKIPNNITIISGGVFRNCTNIKNIEIPEKVTDIETSAFQGCKGLTSITIPNSVKSIRYSAFEECNNLKTVINFSNLTFSKGSTDYGYVAYYANKIINAPNGFTYRDYILFINDNENTCTYAAYMSTVGNYTIPTYYNNIPFTSIGDYAFSYCTGIINVTIPDNITSIGDYAFCECRDLHSVYLKPSTPPKIGTDIFSGINVNIYVPKGSGNIYKEQWKEYSNYIKEEQ